MCDLATAATIGTTLLQGDQQSKAYSQQAQIANQNAVIANNQANQVQIAKQSEEAAIQEKKRQTIGTARASLAANGSDTGMGTGLGAIQDIAYGAQKDIDNLNYNAAVDQNNYKQVSQYYKNQASVLNSYSSNAMTGAVLGAAAAYGSSLSPYKASSASASTGTDWSTLINPNGSVKKYNYLGNNYDWSKKWGY